LEEARTLLGVSADASAAEIRRAYLDAAKASHPDTSGHGPERFVRVMAAYRRLEQAAPPPAPAAPGPPDDGRTLSISPLQAWSGGSVTHRLPGGRALAIRLPVGLRQGEALVVEGVELRIEIRAEDGMLVRGDDLWITVEIASRVLEEGGRVPVITPLGRRVLWVSRKAGERRLLRAPGLGLPPRGDRPQGCLFVRLAPKAGPLDSAARVLLRRFTSAWAA